MAGTRPLFLYAIGLGSNRRHARFGDPRGVLMAALEAIEADDIEPLDASVIVTTMPFGPSRRRFANAAALIASPLAPGELFVRLQAIEAAFGRRTGQRWGPRTLDLDILLWSEGCYADDRIVIPHPAMAHRAFVLDPLVRLVPGWRHPVSGHSVRQLAVRCHKPKPVDRRATAL